MCIFFIEKSYQLPYQNSTSKQIIFNWKKSPHLLKLPSLRVVLANEILDVSVHVVRQGAVNGRSADVEEMRPQPADLVLKHVRRQLRAGRSETIHRNGAVRSPYPSRNFPVANHDRLLCVFSTIEKLDEDNLKSFVIGRVDK